MATRELPIAEFCETGSGSTPSRANAEYFGGDVPWVKSGELRDGIVTTTEEAVTDAGIRAARLRVVPQGSLLIAMYGATVGRTALLGIDATTNQAVCHVRPDPARADTQYLWFALQAKLPELLARRVGGAQPNISQETIRSTKILLPSLSEQRRIAAILDKADAIRRKRKDAIGLTDELLRSAFLEMFGDPVTNPKGWPVKPLGQLLEFLTSGSRGWSDYYSEKGDTFLRIQNVKRDRLDIADVAYVHAPSSAEAKRTQTRPGDVLLSITADLGRTAVVPADIERAFINQHLAILRPHGVNAEYLSSFLTSEGGQRQIRRLDKGGVKAGLNFDDIRSIDIVLPPDVIQNAFGEKKWHIRRLEAHYLAISRREDDLFNSLVAQAFYGKNVH